MVIQLKHQEKNIWGELKPEPEYDKLSNATIEDVKTALSFISTKECGSSFLKIMPGGYTNNERYKYNDLTVYKKVPGELVVVVPSIDFEHGDEKYIKCHSQNETIRELENLIAQKW